MLGQSLGARISSGTAWTPSELPRAAWDLEFPRHLATALEEGHEPAGSPAAAFVADVRRRLVSGPGFVRLRRFPLATDEENCAGRLRSVARSFGRLLAQTADGVDVGFVRDENAPPERAARTSHELELHTDIGASVPDFVGLLTVRQAARGGASCLASAHAVYNELLDAAPALLATLHGVFFFEDSERTPPYFASAVYDRRTPPRVLYNDTRIRAGHDLAGDALSPAQSEALNQMRHLLRRSAFDLTLKSGDLLLLNNRVVVHGRSRFADAAMAKRLLLRIWMADERAADRFDA